MLLATRQGLSTASLLAAVEDPCVSFVEQDVSAGSGQVPWGLDALDGRVDGIRPVGASNGSGVDVFVLDTGIDSQHEELRTRVLPGVSFTAGADNTTRDVHGHGTHCAGTIAGRTVGVAPVRLTSTFSLATHFLVHI